MPKTKKKNIKRLWVYLIKSKYKLLIVLFLSFFAVIGNTMGTLMVGIGLENFIVNASADNLANMLNFTLLLGLAYFLSFTCTYGVAALVVVVANNTDFHIRKDLFQKLQKLPFSWLDIQSTGDIMSRLTNDIEVVTLTIQQQSRELFMGVITMIGMGIGMFILSPYLTLIFIGTFPILYIVVVLIIKKSQPYFIKKQKYTGKLNGYVEEYVSSQKVVNLFSYQNKVNQEFQKISGNLAEATFKSQLISSSIFPYNNFINNFMLMYMTLISIIFIVNGISFNSAIGLEGVGLIFSFILLQRQFTMPISNFMAMMNQFQLAFAGAHRFFEILNQPDELNDNWGKKINIEHTSVDFKNIDFSYVQNKPIIKNLSFSAKPGTINAIVGATGSGKTTLISLLTRFYDINSGTIMIDNQNVADFDKHDIRNNITIVLQDTFLFSVTIRENISYGNMHATEEDIIHAAKAANAWHFIQQLPKGLDTILASDNSIISEGEKQLIAIARAFLSKAKIIILDEATSYVDTKTEKDIQQAMSKLMEGRTSFVIAHRLSTIKKSDNIIVLKNGELIEQGTHNGLLSKKGLYYEMINSGMPEED
ncbi:MAG: ABC transporter ATP-binding protein [Mycoplasmoidaceae bacterium]